MSETPMILHSRKSILKTVPFSIEELEWSYGKESVTRPYHRIHCDNWVNVLPVLATGEVVLVSQPRVGSFTTTLETVGGVIEPDEKDPTMAARRELEEETGLTSSRILNLGSMNPNPAIMTNTCHFFIAFGCVPAEERRHFPDDDERIVPKAFPVSDLDFMVRTRQINHALSSLCIMLAMKYLNP